MKPKGDGLDIEALDQLLNQSAAYRRVTTRLVESIGVALRDLRTADSMESVIRLQERIITIEMVLGLPKLLMDEIRRRGDK